ncbi:hypothetical protein ACSBR2_012095 [Camellia fascicularis]
MGVLIKLIDAVLLFFFLVVILASPAFDAQVCFPSEFFPNFLVDLNLWFTSEYGDYLLIEKPSFFVGLMWLELLFQWPLAIANLYAILVGGKLLLNSTCLVYGVSVFTGMVAVLAKLILSSRITNVLMMMYLPFLGFAVLTILCRLLPCSRQTKMNAEVPALV